MFQENRTDLDGQMQSFYGGYYQQNYEQTYSDYYNYYNYNGYNYNPYYQSAQLDSSLSPCSTLSSNSSPSSSSSSSTLSTKVAKRVSLDHAIEKSGQIEVKLSNESLWQKFDAHTTEMIITKQGRRMFPTLQFSVRGLDPDASYDVFVDMVLLEEGALKFQSGKWVSSSGHSSSSSGHSSSSSAHSSTPTTRVYLHPDSPNTGAFWMKSEIAFSKLKLTNNKSSPDNQILLQSMHKYQPRLHISAKQTSSSSDQLRTFSFNETKFVAVTAYQNTDVSYQKSGIFFSKNSN